MQWVLKILCYEIGNNKGDNYRKECSMDMLLMIAYAFVSLWNAVKGFLPAFILTKIGIPVGSNPTGSTPSMSVVIINIFVLIRLNIGFYIKLKEGIKIKMKELSQERVIVNDLMIGTWIIRMAIIVVGYIIDTVILVYCCVYNSQVATSLAWVIVVTIIETLFNNIIDNLVIRYEAVPKVYKSI